MCCEAQSQPLIWGACLTTDCDDILRLLSRSHLLYDYFGKTRRDIRSVRIDTLNYSSPSIGLSFSFRIYLIDYTFMHLPISCTFVGRSTMNLNNVVSSCIP